MSITTSLPVIDGVDMVGGKTLSTVPFTLTDNRIFVDGRINGAGPFHMTFDTGGANVLTPEAARQLGLTLVEMSPITGGGDGSERAWRAQVHEAALGDVRMRDLNFIVVSLAPIKRAIGFDRSDGLFGHELLRRFVVHIDYDRSQLSFAEPGHAPAAWFENTAELPIDFVDNLPRVSANLNGENIRAIIDTGDRSSLSLFVPFVEAHHLRDPGRPLLRGAITGWGIGSPLRADVMRTDRLDLGGFVVRNVTTRLPNVHGGVFAGAEASGSIGTGVLKRFAVTFDYQHQRMYLARGGGFNAPEPFDRSGMWIRLGDPGATAFEIFDVAPGSPAAEAGLHAGDSIVAIDGRPTANISLIDFRSRLSAMPNGASVRFRARNASGEYDATMVLREPR